MSQVRQRFATSKLAAFCLAAIVTALSTQAACNSWGNDRSDTWWDPNESGWGVLMTQQLDIIFLSFYIYGQDRKATWLGGALRYDGAAYQGNLIESTGPNHLGPFDPATVTRTVVGTARLVPTGDHRFLLTYTVGGVTVNKNIERLTFANNSIAGNYYGGLVGTTSNCSPSSLNGYLTSLANMTVSHNGSNVLVTGLFENNRGGTTSCSFAGSYQQYGRMGEVYGNYTCLSGESGTFNLKRLEVTENGFLATASVNSNFCRFEGRFGAVRN